MVQKLDLDLFFLGRMVVYIYEKEGRTQSINANTVSLLRDLLGEPEDKRGVHSSPAYGFP